jgi:hypothetical protein
MPRDSTSGYSGLGTFSSLIAGISSPNLKNISLHLQLFSNAAVKCYREQNATSFLMGQLSVAYGGTTEKLAQLFPPSASNLDIASFID